MKFSFKIGSVPYRNAVPLIDGIENIIQFMVPRELAKALQRGEVQMALVPVIECLEHAQDYLIVHGHGIGCRGTVQSVLIAHQPPINVIRTVDFGKESRTSVELLKLLLDQHWKVAWEEAQEKDADAHLLIGDKALEYHRLTTHENITDLGEAWMEWTGLPFVFAVWALRKDAHISNEEIEDFKHACALGVSKRSDLASDEAEKKYFTEYIHYELDELAKQGLERFRQELLKSGVLQSHSVPLQWV